MITLQRFVTSDTGADLIEYAFLAGLLAFGCIAAMTSLGANLVGYFTRLGTKLDALMP